MKKYRVYIEQVNAIYVEVVAENENDAREKAYTEWRRDEGHSKITWVEKV